MSSQATATPPAVTPDPTKVPDNATGDGNRVQIDPNKPAGGEQKPEEKLILGKFKDQAALEAAYSELEKKLGKPDASTMTGDKPTIEQAREAVQKAGLDMTALSKEYTENGGKLTDTTLKALEAKGITKTAVDQFIEGQKAIATQMQTDFEKIAGSAENLKTLYDWAGTNLSTAEVKQYNALVESGNLDAAKLALTGMISRYNDAMGVDPNLVGGESVPTQSGVEPYKSNNEIVTAMSDPRYKTDEAYREAVARRLDVTEILNVRDVTRR